MPQIMCSIVEIMNERQRDTLFMEFPGIHSFDIVDDIRSRAVIARQRHLEWFEASGITWEAAAPRGWLEGDPGVYLLHVEPDASQVAAYTAVFETADGRSLDPEAYQMVLLRYEDWLRAQPSLVDDGPMAG